MPIEFNPPSRLMAFSQAASGDGADKTIRATEKGAVETTTRSTSAKANQQTIQNFVSALRSEFGTRIADAALHQINFATNDGQEPLKGFMVRAAMDKALASYQHNLLTRDRFFANVGEPNFNTAIGRALDGLPEEHLRAQVAADVRTELQARVQNTTPTPSLDEIVEMMGRVPVFQATRTLLSPTFVGRDLPGTVEDKVAVLNMFSPERDANKGLEGLDGLTSLVLQKLPKCRELQPQGALTRETIWVALTDEAFPGDQEIEAKTFARALQEKVETQLSTALGGAAKAKTVLAAFRNLNYEAAIEIANNGRPLKLEDYLRPETLLESCRQKAGTQEVTDAVAQTVATLSNRTMDGKKVTPEITFKMYGGPTKLPCGQATESTYPFTTKDGKKAFLEGRPSLYTQDLQLRCETLSDGRPAQRDALFALFSASPEKFFGAGTGALLGSAIDAHTPFNYTLERAVNDAVRVVVTSQDAPQAGRAQASILVSPDGTYRFETIKVESPTVAQIHERISAKTELSETAVSFLTASYFAQADKAALPGLPERVRNAEIDAYVRQYAGSEGMQFISTHITPTWTREQCMAFSQKAENKSKTELESYFQPNHANYQQEWQPNSIAWTYLVDAARDKRSTINGEPFRRTPLGDPMPGVTNLQFAGFVEQLCEAIPAERTRMMTSILTCQSGLLSTLAVGIAHDKFLGKMPTFDASFLTDFSDHKFTITVDPALPNAANPNQNRFAHIQCDFVVAFRLGPESHAIKALSMCVIADIPFEQPANGMPNVIYQPIELKTLV